MAFLQLSRQRSHCGKYFEIGSREVYDAAVVLIRAGKGHSAENCSCDRNRPSGQFARRQACLFGMAATARIFARDAEWAQESGEAIFGAEFRSVYLTSRCRNRRIGSELWDW